MKGSYKKEIEIIIFFTEEEAEWLKCTMQYGLSDKKSDKDVIMIKDLLTLLDNNLRSL